MVLNIWDVGGQSLGGKMLHNYLEGADAVALVFDITSRDSFDNLPDWLEMIRRHSKTAAKPPVLVLLANKC